VGGVGADAANEWLQAGVDGFGIGSEIYQPGCSAEKVYQSAQDVVNAVNKARGN
jgi:2-dehydro-3-deoxyphosphogalactonate aldolase